MKVSATLGVVAAVGLAAIASVMVTGPASAAVDGRTRVGCATTSITAAMRRAYVRDGARIGPLHFGEPGCTASGCSNEERFYVYS